MKTRTAIMATLLASAGAIWTEAAHGQCDEYYNTPKPLIDDRESRAHENVITEALSELHDFMNKDGKSARGRVHAYNPDTGVVTIAMENGKTFGADLGTFSNANQAYVREWHFISEFFTQVHINVFTKKEQSGVGMEFLIWRPEEEIVYVIELENQSNYALNDLTVDYCIYYELDRPGNRGRGVEQGEQFGTLNIETLAGGEQVQVKTQSLVLPKGIPYEYYKDHKAPIGRVQGICIRIYLPLTGGNKVMREFSLPDNLRKHRNWVTDNVPDGLNK